ncbi:MAG: flagellar basal-body MS-ring/collar protein FliF [Victivallales bacterium]|nr:flagellar basal-body MS-ring/collar protein FliF [Victivallales bacterium]
MNGVFGNLLSALVEIWKNIGIAQKVSIILIALVSMGVVGGILYLGSRPDWRILYSDMDNKTAAQVCDIIRDNNIPMKITNGGKTIMVPSRNVYDLRLKTAAAGIAIDRKGSGFELFDNMRLGLTDRQQKVAYQRAIQGELQRMISEIPGIADARVMVTMPTKTVFNKGAGRPTAAIMLVMARGAAIGGEQVNSIRYLVAGAVPGMTPADVTITDNRGRLLRRQQQDNADMGGDPGSRLELTQRMEEDLKEKAEAILRPIVGTDNVVAMVSCDFDFEKIDRVVETINSEQATVISEKTVTDDSQRNGASRGQAAGAAAARNATDQVELAVGAPENELGRQKNMSEQRKTVERQFVVPKSMEKISSNGGRIKRLTVAVTIGQNKDGKSWSDQEMASFEKLVAAAVGVENYQIDKGVKPVTVTQMPFLKPAPPQPVAVPWFERIMEQLNTFGGSGLIRPVGGIFLLLLLYSIFRKYFSRAATVAGVDMERGFDHELYGEGGVGEEPALDSGQQAKALESAGEALQNRMKATPQSIAEFMENWMAQG